MSDWDGKEFFHLFTWEKNFIVINNYILLPSKITRITRSEKRRSQSRKKPKNWNSNRVNRYRFRQNWKLSEPVDRRPRYLVAVGRCLFAHWYSISSSTSLSVAPGCDERELFHIFGDARASQTRHSRIPKPILRCTIDGRFHLYTTYFEYERNRSEKRKEQEFVHPAWLRRSIAHAFRVLSPLQGAVDTGCIINLRIIMFAAVSADVPSWK